MSINQVYDDKRTVTGKSSMLLYRDPLVDIDNKYHILIPLTTVPFVAGSVDTVEYSFTTSETKGKLETGTTLDEKETEVMLHRDNIKRLEALHGKVLDFLVVNGDFSGRGFVATVSLRFNDQTRDEVSTGTLTIVPKSADTVSILDCRPLIKETAVFTNAIPDRLTIGTEGQKFAVTTYPSDATITANMLAVYNPNTRTSTANTNFVVDQESLANKIVKISKSAEAAEGPQYGIVEITATKEGFASWSTTVAVEY